MMKRQTSLFVAFATLLSAVLVALAVAAPALADDYQYTVRVFPGNRGTLSADPVVRTVPKGGSVDLYEIATATITDAKYIQTGFRQSGTDKLIGGNGVVTGITEDIDYVVAYGVEAQTVPYTLNFVEYETGRELAKPQTYYGKVGEKPVAAYEHIEGYRPRYLAITGTLRADEENVWTFEYIPLAEGETIVTTTTTTTTNVVTVPGPTTYVTEEGGTTGTTTEGAAATTEGGAAATTEGGEATATEGGNATTTESGTEGTEGAEGGQPATQEILDLDTPMAGPGAAANGAAKVGNEASLLSSPALIAAFAVVAAAATALIIFLIKIKKDKEDEEEA